LIEPYRNAPRLVILGDSLIAEALLAHASLTDIRCHTDEAALDDLTDRDFVVVASQGRNDSVYLARALASDAGRVSMVASRRKAAALTAKLADKDIPQVKIDRLKAPAGLDIKAIDPHGIAVSILAEITLWRSEITEISTQEVADEKMA
jgi:xanthine dehydrogenase accessory factor